MFVHPVHLALHCCSASCSLNKEVEEVVLLPIVVYCDLLVKSTSFTHHAAFSHSEFHSLSTFVSVHMSEDEVSIFCAESYVAASAQKSYPARASNNLHW